MYQEIIEYSDIFVPATLALRKLETIPFSPDLRTANGNVEPSVVKNVAEEDVLLHLEAEDEDVQFGRWAPYHIILPSPVSPTQTRVDRNQFRKQLIRGRIDKGVPIARFQSWQNLGNQWEAQMVRKE